MDPKEALSDFLSQKDQIISKRNEAKNEPEPEKQEYYDTGATVVFQVDKGLERIKQACEDAAERWRKKNG